MKRESKSNDFSWKISMLDTLATLTKNKNWSQQEQKIKINPILKLHTIKRGARTNEKFLLLIVVTIKAI